MTPNNPLTREPQTAPADHATELVGPGKYPLRIQPAAAIQPGERDARRLLIIWFVRKSFYWMLFLGFAVGVTVARIHHTVPEIDTSGHSLAWLGLTFALVLRFVTGWLALGLAPPLAIAHEPNLSPRSNFGSGIGRFFDRLHLARAFRGLRWTHHVREVAQHRLGDSGRRLCRLDPILDVVNIAAA